MPKCDEEADMNKTMSAMLGVVLAWSASLAYAQTPAAPTTAASVDTRTAGYLLVVGRTTDRAKIGAYASALPPIYAAHNGSYLALGGPGRGVTWLEGPWSDRTLILATFPTRAAIDAFWWGDAYRAAIRKRDGAGVFSVVALSGNPPLQTEGSNAGYLIVMTGSHNQAADTLRTSQSANEALVTGIRQSGGTLLTSGEAGQFTALEGDTVFDRFVIAAWPTTAARDAYLASPAARRAARLRARVRYVATISATGVVRAQPAR
jgi:uncharacterized protein (DUF1330 family)